MQSANLLKAQVLEPHETLVELYLGLARPPCRGLLHAVCIEGYPVGLLELCILSPLHTVSHALRIPCHVTQGTQSTTYNDLGCVFPFDTLER